VSYAPNVKRSCPSCRADLPLAVASVNAASVVRGNPAYRPDALDVLGLPPGASSAIVKCSQCGFVYALDDPDATFLSRLYGEAIANPEAMSGAPLWIAHQLELASSLLARVADREAIRILDYGCGDGTVVKVLAASGISCVGFEPYPRTAGPDVLSSRDDLAARAPFDAVLLSDVLEHVSHPGDVLAECHRLLSPGGWLGVRVPDFSDARLRGILLDLSAGRVVTPELNPWEHLNYFSPSTLAAMLARAGFAADPEPARAFGFRAGERGLRRLRNTLLSVARLLRFAASPAPATTTIFARRA